MIIDEHALEVQEELKKQKIIPDDSKLDAYKQLPGGADTTIFEINIQNHPKKYIQRIFRATNPPNISNGRTEFEFSIQKTLFENRINVPKPYFMKLTPNSRERPYFIMEKIEGMGLYEVLEKNQGQYIQLLENLLQEMHKIHSINPKIFPQIPLPDIQKNPLAPVNRVLVLGKIFVERFEKDLIELKPVIDWLEDNKGDNHCKKLVVIHGDYQPSNIIVQEDREFNILDWTNIQFSDFRMELGSLVVNLNCGTEEDLEPLILSIYEQISGDKVENLSFFMILSHMINLIRMYSGVNNPIITNENEDTMNFFKSIKFYPLYLVEMVKDVCNIELDQIKDYFN